MSQNKRMNEGADVALVIAITKQGRTPEIEPGGEFAVFSGDLCDNDLLFRSLRDHTEGGGDGTFLQPHGLFIADAPDEFTEARWCSASGGLGFQDEDCDVLAVHEPPKGGPYCGKPTRNAGTPTEIESASTTDPATSVEYDQCDATETRACHCENRESRCSYDRHGKTWCSVFGDWREVECLGLV